MLDAIKGLAGAGKAQKRAEELEALIATAREERGALSAMIDTVTMHSAKLTETGKSLEQVSAKAVAAAGPLDAVAKRIEELEQKATALVDWTCPGFVDGYGLGFQALCGSCLLS